MIGAMHAYPDIDLEHYGEKFDRIREIVDASEVFNARANAQHLDNLQVRIESLESCGSKVDPGADRL